MQVYPISIPLPFSRRPKFHRVIPPSSQPKITSLYNIWPRNWFSPYVSFRRNYFMSSPLSCSRFSPIPSNPGNYFYISPLNSTLCLSGRERTAWNSAIENIVQRRRRRKNLYIHIVSRNDGRWKKKKARIDLPWNGEEKGGNGGKERERERNFYGGENHRNID